MSALSPHPIRRAPEGPLFFVVMDGVGIGAGDASDAVAAACTPTLDWLRQLPSASALLAHGVAVGMPSDRDMGNSEVGHNTIGAGRVFAQGAKLVASAIASGQMFEGEAWQRAVAHVRASGEALHFVGLLSDGNVHSHIDHLVAMLERAAAEGVARSRVHILLDGRDVEQRSALRYIDQLEAVLTRLRGDGRDYCIASGGGRMKITMDRYEADWNMVAEGWRVHVQGQGRRFNSAREAVETMYAESSVSDQWLEGFVIADASGPVGPIRDGASVLLFNFRGDRALELSRAFESGPEFREFDRGEVPDVFFAGMMQYDGDLRLPKSFLVEPPAIDRTMGELLARAGKRQLAIAETHKYGHVTYFWNGNRSGRFDPSRETYIEVASDLDPLEERPWMKAAEVTDRLVAEVQTHPYDLVRVNYANGDMVGHTGDLHAARMAVEAVDLCVGRLVAVVKRMRGILLVTADHGNADQMFEFKNDERIVRTSHSLNPVPFAVFDPSAPGQSPRLSAKVVRDTTPGLANLAATTLELLGLRAPEDYEPSLLANPDEEAG
ncbi:MAG: 2,3-bisphosphoglycerate-independent phosphoglycerate mutase [Myxococcales bacterium FL481]|nr:MAG: 2,3-bisphosphoglycerate-independent phosphoglycerate mutase [Myxococcales bacterium FL481]